MRLPSLRALFALLVPLFGAACGEPSSDSNPILHLEEGRLVDGVLKPGNIGVGLSPVNTR